MSITLRFDLTFSWDRHSWIPLHINANTGTTKNGAKTAVAGRLGAAQQLLVGIILGASVIGSQIVTTWHQALAVYIDPAIFLVLVTIALINRRVRKLLLATAIIPFVNFSALTMTNIHGFNQTLVLYESLLVTSFVLWTRFLTNKPSRLKVPRVNVDWNKLALLVSAIIVIGESISYLGYLTLPHQTQLFYMPFVAAVGSLLLFAIAETLLFQGLIQSRLKRLVSPFMAVVITAVMYTGLHIGVQHMMINLIFASVVGVVLALSYYIRQNVFVTTALNAIIKLVYFGLLATFVVH